jgi:hypothetical protein
MKDQEGSDWSWLAQPSPSPGPHPPQPLIPRTVTAVRGVEAVSRASGGGGSGGRVVTASPPASLSVAIQLCAYLQSEERINAADGWGRFKTPYGLPADVKPKVLVTGYPHLLTWTQDNRAGGNGWISRSA